MKSVLLAGCLLLAAAACRLGPRPPQDLPTVVEPDAEEFSHIWQSALSIDGGDIMLLFDEQQLTSFLAGRLNQAERPLVEQPQIYLRDGVISIYGVSKLGPIELGAVVEIQPVTDPQGTITLEIMSAKLGPLPAPQVMMSGLSELLTEAFTGKLGPLATGIRITSLAVADGKVAIVGSLR